MSSHCYGTRAAGAALAALLWASPAGAQETLAVTNVTVISMADSVPTPNRSVLVRDGRITRIGPASAVRIPAGARVVDGRGRYLIPGLFDMHVHTSKTRASALGLYVVHGVTTVRDQGSEHAEVLLPPDLQTGAHAVRHLRG